MTSRPHIMTDLSWHRMAKMKPIANLDRLVGPNTPLARHIRAFVSQRKERIDTVSKMTLDQQCAYYRSLGFFKPR